MNFLKKLFGLKSESQKEENPVLIIVTLNDKIQPIDRGEYYEDPLDEYLKQNRVGEVTGGGTMQAEDGEIEFVNIEIQLNRGADPKNTALQIIDFLKVKNAPKESKLRIENTNEEIGFGGKEGLAIYLDGQNLDPGVYESCDVNFVVEKIRELTGDESEIVRFWEFPNKTALYFYGNSYQEMKEQIRNFVGEYPLCKNAEIKQIA